MPFCPAQITGTMDERRYLKTALETKGNVQGGAAMSTIRSVMRKQVWGEREKREKNPLYQGRAPNDKNGSWRRFKKKI